MNVDLKKCYLCVSNIFCIDKKKLLCRYPCLNLMQNYTNNVKM